MGNLEESKRKRESCFYVYSFFSHQIYYRRNLILSEIKVPTLVLVGEHDIPDVHAHSGVIEVGIPNAKREIILKAGHLIPLEQPAVFNSSVLAFFKKNGML